MRAFIAAFALVLIVAASASAAGVESRIVSVMVDPEDLVSGGPVSVTVLTTPDIVSVIALAGPRRINIPQVEPGCYYGTATVPRLPRFIRGHFRVTFIGRTAAGDEVDAETTVQLN